MDMVFFLPSLVILFEVKMSSPSPGLFSSCLPFFLALTPKVYKGDLPLWLFGVQSKGWCFFFLSIDRLFEEEKTRPHITNYSQPTYFQ